MLHYSAPVSYQHGEDGGDSRRRTCGGCNGHDAGAERWLDHSGKHFQVSCAGEAKSGVLIILQAVDKVSGCAIRFDLVWSSGSRSQP